MVTCPINHLVPVVAFVLVVHGKGVRLASLTNVKTNIYFPKSVREGVTMPLNNNNTNCSFIYVDDSQFAMTEFRRELMRNKSNTEHIAFLSPLVINAMKEIARPYDVPVVGVHADNCKIETEHENKEEMFMCNTHFPRLLATLIAYFGPLHVAIIYERLSCYQVTARRLHKILNAVNDSFTLQSVSLYHVPSKLNTKQLFNIFQNVKLKEVTLTVLLVRSLVSYLIFDVAGQLGLNSYGVTWILHNHESHVWDEYFPWQVINLQKKSVSTWNARTLSSVLNEVAIYTCTQGATTLASRVHQAELNKRIDSAVDCKNTKSEISVSTRKSVIAGEFEWIQVFEWLENTNLSILPEASVLMRMIAPNRHRPKLKITTVVERPFAFLAAIYFNEETGKCDQGLLCSVFSHTKKDWVVTCCSGMLIDMLNYLKDEMFIEPQLYVVRDGLYGSISHAHHTHGEHPTTTLNWNGVVQELIYDQADLALAALILTKPREKVIDFVEPFMSVALSVMTKDLNGVDTDSINWEFIQPLSYDLRIWILVTFAIGTVSIYILENQHLVLKRITDKEARARYRWRDGFSYFSGLTFQRDLGGKNPQKPGARVTAILFAFGMVIIMTTYTAVLTAAKVSSGGAEQFLGFQDERLRNPTTAFKVGTVKLTGVENYFENSYDENYKKLSHEMVKYETTRDAVDALNNGAIKALIYTNPILTYHRSQRPSCDFKIYGPNLQQGGYSFAVKKDSPWKDIISQAIIRLKDRDIVDRLYGKWFPAYCVVKMSDQTYTNVEVTYFSGLFLIVATCIFFSFVLLGAEYFCYNHHRRVINPIQDKVQEWKEVRAGRRNALIDAKDIKRVIRGKVPLKRSDTEEDSTIDEEEADRLRALYAGRRRMSRAQNDNDGESPPASLRLRRRASVALEEMQFNYIDQNDLSTVAEEGDSSCVDEGMHQVVQKVTTVQVAPRGIVSYPHETIEEVLSLEEWREDVKENEVKEVDSDNYLHQEMDDSEKMDNLEKRSINETVIDELINAFDVTKKINPKSVDIFRVAASDIPTNQVGEKLFSKRECVVESEIISAEVEEAVETYEESDNYLDNMIESIMTTSPSPRRLSSSSARNSRQKSPAHLVSSPSHQKSPTSRQVEDEQNSPSASKRPSFCRKISPHQFHNEIAIKIDRTCIDCCEGPDRACTCEVNKAADQGDEFVIINLSQEVNFKINSPGDRRNVKVIVNGNNHTSC